jgi:hypothetical protein
MLISLLLINVDYRCFEFKTLPNPKRKAAKWLKNHPMECVAWAATKARCSPDEIESSDDDDDEEGEGVNHENDGTMDEVEKEMLRTLPLAEVLASSSTEQRGDRDPSESGTSSSSDSSEDSSDSDDSSDTDESVDSDDECIDKLKRALDENSPFSLKYRHINRILDSKLEQRETKKKMEESSYRQRQNHLINRGVSKELIHLLPKDAKHPMPTPIRDALEAQREKTARQELEAKNKRAKDVFKDPWLVKTEKDLYKCIKIMNTSSNQEKREGMRSLSSIIVNKLKLFHEKRGTLTCQIALQERRRMLVDNGWLRREHQHVVETIFQAMPIIEDDVDIDAGTQDSARKTGGEVANKSVDHLITLSIKILFHSH